VAGTGAIASGGAVSPFEITTWDGSNLDSINTQGFSGTTLDETVPGPVAGAGLLGELFAGGGLLAWWRSRRKSERRL
jgi:hypothetical protein